MSHIRRLKEELKKYHELKVGENDDEKIYALDYDEADITTIHAVIKGPVDSLYKWKFVRLQMKFRHTYPFAPPEVKFIQFNGHRIHPNLYVQGKVCLSILNTWTGPKWQPTLNIDTILRTIQSLLDNEPYVHEPEQRDNTEYNIFVEYHTWRTMFLDLHKNTDERPELQAYMLASTLECASSIKRYMKRNASEQASPFQLHVAPYGIGNQMIDWKALAKQIDTFLKDYE